MPNPIERWVPALQVLCLAKYSSIFPINIYLFSSVVTSFTILPFLRSVVFRYQIIAMPMKKVMLVKKATAASRNQDIAVQARILLMYC